MTHGSHLGISSLEDGKAGALMHQLPPPTVEGSPLGHQLTCPSGLVVPMIGVCSVLLRWEAVSVPRIVQDFRNVGWGINTMLISRLRLVSLDDLHSSSQLLYSMIL